MIRIDKKASIDSSEAFLNEISAGSADLALSERLHDTACGGAAAIAQVVFTWARQNPSASFTPLLDCNRDLGDLVKRLPGLIAIMMAGKIGNEEADEGAERRRAYAAAKEIVSKMDEREYRNTTKGIGVSLVCADETTKAYLSPFYASAQNRRPVLRAEEEFQYLASKLLEAAVNQVRFDEVVHLANDLGVMIRELIDNTDRYARQDINGNRLRKSVRGLHAQSHHVSPDRINSLAGEYAPLARYLTRIEQRMRFKTAQILEISIFDSGPGFAAHAMGRQIPSDYDIGEELKLVRSRFLERNHEYTRDGAGKGLRRTLERLKKDSGFIRLRTGRTSLYKDFSLGSETKFTPEDMQLDDAFGGHPAARAEGTLLTLLVPLAVNSA
ncbi:hypothetical protein [Gluconobacter cerinus]|uniref:hypothetical protein n=1 Tax=Gluconobacter cerinus TaxID=38307 RepID=UPI001B8CAD92|nr:hypothetical protein [Gluconobacter cerinus]MBS1043577.1 hypothetical protein [Gluconobacter cerinus]